MFSSITRQTKADFDTLKRVLDTHDAIRNLIFPEEKIKDLASLDPDKQQLSETLQNIKSGAPQRNDWLIYDHCAALPRLYAIFEQFVEDLATEYLALLPALYPSYNDLPLRVATQHRVGVAQILQKLGKDGPYKDIAERDVIEGLAKGQFGLDAYTLFPEAFLIDPQNYRAEIVNKIFQYLGFDDL